MKKNNSGFAQVILVIILIVLVGGGMYYFGTLKDNSKVTETPTEEPIATETQKPGNPTVKPTADPTAEWKTYTNSDYGFSLKYPQEMQFTNSEKPSFSLVYLGPKQVASGRTQTSLFDGYKVNVSVSKVAEGGSLSYSAGYLHDHTLQSCPNPLEASVSPMVGVSLDGVVAKKFNVTNCFGDYTITVVDNDGNEFVITQTYVADSSEQISHYQKATDQILSTFKFTK